MEDRCIVCGEVIPEGRHICSKHEANMLSEEQIAINRLVCGNTAHSCKADYIKLAIKALETQDRLKTYIKRMDQPEYKEVVWKQSEAIMLLKEILADRS